MKRAHLVATRPLRYRNRALRTGDGFGATLAEADLYVAVGIASRAPSPARPEPAVSHVPPPTVDASADELDAARAEYEVLVGRAPDKRWGLPRLRGEIAAAKSQLEAERGADGQ